MISIIVPIYNMEKYLDRCIRSILNQTYKDFELILVNDGSTDNSLNICLDYIKKDKRIKLVNKMNGGLSSARNAGIKLSKGKYIGFVDSDDYIHPQMYEILKKELEANNCDISICRYMKVNDDKRIINKILNYEVAIYNNIESLKMLYSDLSVDFIVSWNKLYKREMFENILFEEGRINEDEFIIHKLLFCTKKVIYIDAQLYFYYTRCDSITNKKFDIKNLDAIDAFYDRMIFFRKNKNMYLIEKSEDQYLYYIFSYYFHAINKQNKSAIKFKQIKHNFRKNILYFIKNKKKYKWKQKIMWIVFAISPSLYIRFRRIIERKD